MKKGFIKTVGEPINGFGQGFGIFVEGQQEPVTTHFCSHAGYAEMDLLRHTEAKYFDVIYGLRGNIVYMNGEIDSSAKDKFNDAERLWRASNYSKDAPSSHLV